MNSINLALVGQPNCGKSTIFNMLTNIKQHIANYPGVTVDKKEGSYTYKDSKYNVIDLPGTYSFSSYSEEEKITRSYILNKETNIIINTIDASNLRRNLYLTMQLFDMQKPMIIAFNMLDIAKQNGQEINFEKLEKLVNAKVVQTVATKKQGLNELKDSIIEVNNDLISHVSTALFYEKLQPYIDKLKPQLNVDSFELSKHFICIKLFENDEGIKSFVKNNDYNYDEIFDIVQKYKEEFKDIHKISVEQYIVKIRYEKADELLKSCTTKSKTQNKTISEKIDTIILNKFLALPILGLIIFTLYKFSIVYGYDLTNITWPILAWVKYTVVSLFPSEDISSIPYLTQLAIWMMNSIIALLNYIPIFLILFFLIAILEDVGYMPRMAFILDRVFSKFGLHGESTLPLVLSGIFAGGCAVPGVMATKGMNDKRAKIATILTIPLMNCLAKIPFFILIIVTFFKVHMSLMMFMISTITLFIALIISKLLSISVLKAYPNTPFIMELPSYHIPTLRGLLVKVFDRVWLYLKKIVTIVAAVAIVLFVLIQFPGLSQKEKNQYDIQSKAMQDTFYKQTKHSTYFTYVNEKKELKELINFYTQYKYEKMNTKDVTVSKAIDEKFQDKNQLFFLFAKPNKNKEARKINKALKILLNTRKKLLRELKNNKIENSFLGSIGKFFVPVTQYAGFDWKINVAFLSSFAARESSVSTLGALYESNQNNSLGDNHTYSPLSAVAIIIFMALTPPCIATMIMIKIQTNSLKWMLFALFYPITLGLICAIFIFQMGTIFSLSEIEAMGYFYIFIILITLALGLIPTKKETYV
ncbi:MAG: ferrous iron transport protein B [Arcobacter sp.]|uniref:ferrous iron transport protein B n=1 Tax=Arcobacter sp. TaxID=1872629 RepID=UPI003C70E1FB